MGVQVLCIAVTLATQNFSIRIDDLEMDNTHYAGILKRLALPTDQTLTLTVTGSEFECRVT